MKKSNIIALCSALIIPYTMYSDIKKDVDGWNFSLPKTQHNHTVEMLSKSSALRLIACAASITGLVLIKESISRLPNGTGNETSSYAKAFLSLSAGLLFVGISIYSIVHIN